MFNATKSAIIIGSIAASLIASSCSGDKKAAEELREQAAAAIEASDPAGAIILLDSLDRAYPAEVATRRSAMPLRPRAIELQTLRDLEVNDSLTAQNTVVMEQMKEFVKLHPGAGGTDGYYVATIAENAVPSSAEGLYARMSPEGAFYIISSARKGTRSTSITVSAKGAAGASTPAVAPDGERNDRSLAMETITFLPAECDTIGEYVMTNGEQDLTLTFHGEGADRSITLPRIQSVAIAQIYAASQVYSRARLLALQKSKLEQQLMLARSQQARMMPEK